MLNYFLQWSFTAWIVYVVIKYFSFHPEYTQAFTSSNNLFINFAITFIVTYWIYFLYKGYVQENDKVEIKRSPFFFIMVWFFWVLLVATILYSKWKLIAETWYFQAIWSLLIKIAPIVITLFGTLVISFLIWNTISRLLKITWSDDKKWIINITFWLAVLSFINYLIVYFGELTKLNVLLTGLIIVIFCFKSFKDLYAWFFASNKEKSEIKFLSIETFLYIVLFFFHINKYIWCYSSNAYLMGWYGGIFKST